ncbi:MAG: leucine-rich repeat protein [Prevotella sp.]|nr:leucine-rich repeat protein [Prevotella sp.]
MKQKLFLLTLLIVGYNYSVKATIEYYSDSELHLNFKLDTDTKEATIGTGLDRERANAIYMPPYDDPWWNTGENLWQYLDIPSTITYKNITYTVREVAPFAFFKSSSIQNIKLPETVRHIGAFAFYWCNNLKSINIPDLVTSIEESTFVWCNKLESIELPANISYIGNSAFSDCINLKSINIPRKCASVGDEAFKWCTSLSTLIIEDGTTPLKLACCYGLGLNYDGSMSKHYRGMFSDCPLKRLHLGRDIEFFSEFINGWYPPFMGYYYKGKGTDNKDIFIDEGKIYEEVTIGDNVTVIPEAMFKYATIPNSITLPSQLRYIGDDAFSNRSGTDGTLHQQQLVFPATLEYVGKHAFTNCSRLGTIVCEGTTPPALPDRTYYNAFSGCNILFFVPQNTRTTYLNTDNWSGYKIVEASDIVVTINVKTAGTLFDRLNAQGYQLGTITRLKLKGTLNGTDWALLQKMSVLYDLDISELDMEEISEGQFAQSSLIYIKLPQNIKAIRDNAFYQCRNLTGTIEIPVSCTEIGKQAFRETGITGLLYETPLHISEFAFCDCSRLEEVYIKGEGTIVDWLAFGKCGLKKVTIGRGVTLGANAVVLCDNLKEAIIEDGVTSLGENSLYNDGLEKVYFEGAIEEIGRSVFRNEYIEEVHISDIGKWCELTFPYESHPFYRPNVSDPVPTLYYNGEELVNVEIPEGVKRIGDLSFYMCDKLKTVKFPETLESIGTKAFYGCTSMENIQFPPNLESIGSNAFSLCSNLTNIDIPQSVTSISSGAFYNNKLKKVVVHWKNPIGISSNTFYNVPSDCWLYVPIGTASKYANLEWNKIPNIKAVGFLTLKVNTGGSASCDAYNVSVTNNTESIMFTPYQDFYIKLVPNENHKIFKVKLNGVDVLSELENGQLYIEDPDEDIALDITFAENHIEMGDTNGDRAIDEKDAKHVAGHIIKKNSIDSFYGYAADMNDDGVINITDILLIIKKAKELNQE